MRLASTTHHHSNPPDTALFDLLVGISRWLYRVLTYVALMHDDYPPFRLDAGQYEPDQAEPAEPAPVPALVGNRA